MEVKTDAFSELPKATQYQILTSPWATQVEKQIRKEVEATIKAEVVESVGKLGTQRINEVRRENQQHRDETVARIRAELQLDIATRVAATEKQWAAQLKEEDDRNAQVSDARRKEIAALKADLQRLEDQRAHSQRAWDATKADLEDKRQKAQQQREEAVRQVEAEKALLRRKSTEVSVDCSCMGQTVLDHLESGWDGISDQWGHQFRELLDIIQTRLQPAVGDAELEAMQQLLIQEYGRLGHPAVEDAHRALLQNQASKPSLSRSPPEGVRKATYGLATNAVALARTQRRRKEQRTQRSERNCGSFDPSWQISAQADRGCEPVVLSEKEVFDARAVALKGIRFCCMPPHLGGPDPSQQSSASLGAVVLPPLSP